MSDITLQGDQIAVSATTANHGGKRVYVVWMLADGDEPAYEARIAADTPGNAIDIFAQRLADKRTQQFTWRGPAKLTRVKFIQSLALGLLAQGHARTAWDAQRFAAALVDCDDDWAIWEGYFTRIREQLKKRSVTSEQSRCQRRVNDPFPGSRLSGGDGSK